MKDHLCLLEGEPEFSSQSNLTDLTPEEREVVKERLSELFFSIARSASNPPASYVHHQSGDLRPR